MKACKQFFFWLFIILLINPSCKKAFLPKATHTGKNTFGCLVNNKIWKPAPNQVRPVYLYADYNRKLKWLTISASNGKPSQVFLSVVTDNIKSVFDGGQKQCDLSFEGDHGDFSYNQLGKLSIDYLDTLNNKGIISGTFSFSAENPLGERVTVTDGRFDLEVDIE